MKQTFVGIAAVAAMIVGGVAFAADTTTPAPAPAAPGAATESTPPAGPAMAPAATPDTATAPTPTPAMDAPAAPAEPVPFYKKVYRKVMSWFKPAA